MNSLHNQESFGFASRLGAGNPPTALDSPRVINVDKNAAYPKAIDELKKDQSLTKTTELRPVKYLNNIVELRTHRFIKRLVNPGMGCGLI